ncbi:MAG TPA: WYL domain-containing transcriptional regulator [bacterium]|nr:WYL domain-containing transcriptional regulator [bacterium]
MPDHAGRNEQLVRQWNILMKLAAHRTVGVTVGELVEEHGVARRTIERDLDALGQAGFPLGIVSQDGAQKYWGVLGPAPDMPPFPLDQDELIAMWLASGLFDFFAGTPYKDGMDRLRAKIAATLPPRVVARLEDIDTHFAPIHHQRALYREMQGIVSTLNKAILSHRICRMTYFNPSWKEPREYVIKPCGIVVYRQILYLAAFSAERPDVTIFSVRRIRRIEVTDEAFDPPEGFSLAETIDRSFGIYQGEPTEVRIRFDAEVAHYPEEILFHPSQVNKKNTDGSLEVTMTVGGLQEVVWWVLSYTDQVQVLHPPELAEQVRRTALAIAAKYESSTQPTRSTAK